MASQGWVKIDRSIYDDDLWQSDEPFDKRAAWFDLIMMVNHEDKTIVVGMKTLTVKRGQKFTSVRKLAKRWHWSERKVGRYLELLECTGKIERVATHNGTLLTLVKYSFYQGSRDTFRNTNDHTSVHTNDNTNDHTSDRQTRMNKNDKRMIKNEEENNMPSVEDDKRDFWGYLPKQSDEEAEAEGYF